MVRGSWFKYAPLLGLLFVALVAAGFIIGGDTPGTDGTVLEIKDKYDDEARQIIAAFIVALGAVALLFFASHLRGALRIVEPVGRMPNVAFAGAIVAATGFLFAAGMHGGLAEAANEKEVSGQALQALNVLDNWSWMPFAFGTATMVLASGIAIVRGGGQLPRWLGWVAVALGILFGTPVGFFSFLLSGVWVAVVSILLYTRWEALHRDAGSRPSIPGAPAV
jgi:hypothetical protein